MASMLDGFDLAAVEDNASCPNSGEDLLRSAARAIEGAQAIKARSRHPLLLKVSAVHDLGTIVRETEAFVEAYDVNSVPWNVVFPRTPSPLARLGGGGVSGKAAQPHTWAAARRIADATDVPVIGPSVWEAADLPRLRALGASAFSFGSLFLRHPCRPTAIVRDDLRRRADAS